MVFTRIIEHTTSGRKASSRPDPEMTRNCLAFYYLRIIQACTYQQERVARPDVRLATPPTKGKATETRSGRSSCIRTKHTTNTTIKA